MLCLQTGDSEGDRFAVIMQQFMDYLCRNEGHNPLYVIVQHS